MEDRARVLVVVDDPMFCELVALLLRNQRHQVQILTSADGLEERLLEGDIDVVLLDWQLGDQDGLAILQTLRGACPTIPVVLVTATVSTDLAVRAIRGGAFDFLTKPLDETRLIATVARGAVHHRLLDRVHELETEGQCDSVYEGLLGVSPLMRTVFRAIQNIAPADVTVMITGETGTGKELVARAIHRRSGRAAKPFVPLNMAALPKELVEATLFGHEKGAFTGADRRRIGAVEEAMGGTLFLDEIGEMPLELQAKLLRFIQERTLRRVGGNEDISADIRIVSATNRDPLDEVRNGRLRADLYYRLNVVPIALPPLRERVGDVALIAAHCLGEFSMTHKRNFAGIDDEALLALQSFNWPGNVRELRHLIERMVILNEGPHLSRSMLPLEITGHAPPTVSVKPLQTLVRPAVRTTVVARAESDVSPSPESIVPLAELERRAIEHALAACQGSAQSAASKLGMSTATIYRKIKEFGLQSSR